jgi:hypothetical protein
MTKKKNIIISVVVIIVIAVFIFIAGTEYKAYQVRKAVKQIFNETPTAETDISKEAKEKIIANMIEKNIGEEIQLATVKVKVNEASEAQVYNLSYSNPLVAKADTKFVILSVEITNTTKAPFYNSTDFGSIMDSNERVWVATEFLGDKGIAGDLAPDIMQKGDVLYEIPKDATNYSFIIRKAGTDEFYKIRLK